MANAITKFKTYIALLDEVYKQASLTADLDSDPTLVKAGANANEISHFGAPFFTMKSSETVTLVALFRCV